MSVHEDVFTRKTILVGKTRYKFQNDQKEWVTGAKFFVLEKIRSKTNDGEGELTTEIKVPYEKYDEIPLGAIEIDMQLKAGGKGEVIVVDVRKGKSA